MAGTDDDRFTDPWAAPRPPEDFPPLPADVAYPLLAKALYLAITMVNSARDLNATLNLNRQTLDLIAWGAPEVMTEIRHKVAIRRGELLTAAVKACASAQDLDQLVTLNKGSIAMLSAYRPAWGEALQARIDAHRAILTVSAA